VVAHSSTPSGFRRSLQKLSQNTTRESPRGLDDDFSGFLSQLFLDLFQLSFKALVEQAGFFAPGLAFGVPLRGIGSDFAAVYVLVTLRLALEFGAQFVFRHV